MRTITYNNNNQILHTNAEDLGVLFSHSAGHLHNQHAVILLAFGHQQHLLSLLLLRTPHPPAVQLPQVHHPHPHHRLPAHHRLRYLGLRAARQLADQQGQ